MTIAITRRDWWAGILTLTAGMIVSVLLAKAPEVALLAWTLGLTGK